MNSPLQTPFDSVENAQQYVRLLVEAIAEAKSEIAADLGRGRAGQVGTPGTGSANRAIQVG